MIHLFLKSHFEALRYNFQVQCNKLEVVKGAGPTMKPPIGSWLVSNKLLANDGSMREPQIILSETV